MQSKILFFQENSVYEFDTNKLTIKSKSNLLSSLLNITSALTSDIKLKIDVSPIFYFLNRCIP